MSANAHFPYAATLALCGRPQGAHPDEVAPLFRSRLASLHAVQMLEGAGVLRYDWKAEVYRADVDRPEEGPPGRHGC